MQIHSQSVINHPIDTVFTSYRDEMNLVVPWIPDVREIVIADRQVEGDDIRLHNIWRADREIPGFAQRFIKPDMLEWDDFALWHTAERYCEWELKTRFFTEAVRCTGTTRFAAVDANNTRVTLAGDLQIDPRKVPGIPRMLAGRVGPQVEKFIVSLITPNLERVNQSLQQYLDAR